MTEGVSVAAVQNGECSVDIEANIARLERLFVEAAEPRTNLVVLPELCTTPYFPVVRDPSSFRWAEPVPGPTVERFANLARRHNTAAVVGLFESTEAGERYDSAVLLDRTGSVAAGRLPDGRTVPAYRKMMIPSVISEGIDSDEKFFFRPGPGPAVFDLDGLRLGILICYDRSFGEAWRCLALQGAQVIALPLTSLSWREDLFLAELQVRALENCVYVVAANRGGMEEFGGRRNSYFGLSCIIAPDGTVLAKAPPHCQPAFVRAGLELGALEEQRRRLPLWRDRRRDLYELIARLS